MAHVKNVHSSGKKSFACSLCTKRYNDPGNLQYHISAIHEGTRIQCNECDKTFDKDKIKLHIRRVHLKSLEFSCDQCEFLTTEKRFLLGHKQIHKERFKFGPQRCEKCGSYRCICKLKRHNEIVHQELIL